MRRFIYFWGPVIFFACVVFIGSSISHPLSKDPFPHFDKVAHLSEYGLFALLLFRALNGTLSKKSFLLLAVITVLITTGYGASDEFHQYFVPGRSSDLKDLAADGLGSVMAMAAVFIKRRMYSR
ncbi:MAG: VanZ family protein [Nitrospira sp.]|nr:VanZ family protein [Nitrospira sp.]